MSDYKAITYHILQDDGGYAEHPNPERDGIAIPKGAHGLAISTQEFVKAGVSGVIDGTKKGPVS